MKKEMKDASTWEYDYMGEFSSLCSGYSIFSDG